MRKAGAIDIANDQGRRFVQVKPRRIEKLLAFVLKRERSLRGGLSVLITNDRRIARYHKDFLDDPTPTDVISFGLPADAPESRRGHLGDVVVSAQTARRAAAGFGQTPAQELERYCVHGTLHLLGYDDHKPADRKRMHAAQEKHLTAFWNGR